MEHQHESCPRCGADWRTPWDRTEVLCEHCRHDLRRSAVEGAIPGGLIDSLIVPVQTRWENRG